MPATAIAQEIIEGTWEEVSRQGAKLNGHRVRVIVLPEDSMDEEQRRINAPSIALLQSWLSNAPTTQEEIEEAEKDLLEFKQSINLNRSESGQKPAYPDVQ
jgi:molecular chaperone DnaK (HSP70)